MWQILCGVPVDLLGRRAPITLLAFCMVVAGCGGPAGRDGPVAPPVTSTPAQTPATVTSPPAAAPPAAGMHTAPPPKPSGTGGATAEATAAVPVVMDDVAALRTLPAETTQLIIVASASMSATTATLRAYTRTGTTSAWQAALPAVTARLGGNGLSDNKHEGDRTTPAGMYAFDATMYGIAANPGTKFAYHRLVQDDWWNENSSSPGYNTFSHGPGPGGPSEPLWQISPQYTHFAVIRYNMPATPNKGSGIFLHESSGNATAGCVSVPHADLVALLRWLDPAASPRIVISTSANLSRY